MKWRWLTLIGLEACALVAPEVPDRDGDGFVSVHHGGDDCNDADPSVHPGAREIPVDGIDQDCDGTELCHVDADGDGLGGAALVALPGTSCHHGALEPGDCDDADPTVRRRRYHRDADGDGHGDPLSPPVEGCEPPPGHVLGADDCDDADPTVPRAWYLDRDGDGLGAGPPVFACTQPADAVEHDGDCDDADPTVPRAWYLDGDDDGFGAGPPVFACTRPAGAVDRDGDCDDADPTRRPGAVEICGDGVDQDCDPSPRVCGLWGVVSSSSADANWWGDHRTWQLGHALHGEHDVTGDGTPDLVIGAPGTWLNTWNEGRGAVWIASGRALAGSGPASGLWNVVLGDPNDSLGRSVLVDPELGELLIGVTGHVDSFGEPTGAVARVPLPVGSGGVPDLLVGVSNGGTIGRRLAVARFAGRSEVHLLTRGSGRYGRSDLVGWTDVSRWAGEVRLADRAWSPPVSGVFWPSGDTAVADVAAGPAPSGQGDTWAWAFVGPDRVGAAWVLEPPGAAYEAPLGLLRSHVVSTARRSSEAEAHVHIAPDLTGDGHADLVFGLPCIGSKCPNRGEVWVIPGGPHTGPGELDLADVGQTRPGFHLVGPPDGGLFGAAVAAAGDFDGDGYGDLLVGQTDSTVRPGAVYLLYGPLPDGTFHYDEVGDALPGVRIDATDSGWLLVTLARVADVDGDGRDEFAVGVPLEKNPAGNDMAGRVLVWHGRGDG